MLIIPKQFFCDKHIELIEEAYPNKSVSEMTEFKITLNMLDSIGAIDYPPFFSHLMERATAIRRNEELTLKGY